MEMIKAIRDWVTEKEKRLLEKTGDASKVITNFSTYASRTLPKSGETLDITIGKIVKYLNSMYSVAFDGSYNSLYNRPIKYAGCVRDDAYSEAYSTLLYGTNNRRLDSRNAYLIYGQGGPSSSSYTGNADFIRMHYVHYSPAHSNTGANEGWNVATVASTGQTARWSLKSVKGSDISLTLNVPKGSWAEVTILAIPASMTAGIVF